MNFLRLTNFYTKEPALIAVDAIKSVNAGNRDGSCIRYVTGGYDIVTESVDDVQEWLAKTGAKIVQRSIDTSSVDE